MTFTPTHAGDVTRTPTNCLVCGRVPLPAGIGDPERGRDPKYLCEDCITLAYEIKQMAAKPRDFDAYEVKAVEDAGERGGDYLDSIGKTDLASLDPDQWGEFLTAVIAGFGASLRRQIVERRAPF